MLPCSSSGRSACSGMRRSILRWPGKRSTTSVAAAFPRPSSSCIAARARSASGPSRTASRAVVERSRVLPASRASTFAGRGSVWVMASSRSSSTGSAATPRSLWVCASWWRAGASDSGVTAAWFAERAASQDSAAVRISAVALKGSGWVAERALFPAAAVSSRSSARMPVTRWRGVEASSAWVAEGTKA